MKQALYLLLLLLPIFAGAQAKVFDKKTYTWDEVKRAVDSVGNGYHLPDAKQLDSIFKATYDKYLMRSSLTPSTVYTSDSSVVGIMRGREFTSTYTTTEIGSGEPMRYSFILIK